MSPNKEPQALCQITGLGGEGGGGGTGLGFESA